MAAPEPGLTLVRHGETTWSTAGRHTGRTDLELTAAGERQAEAIGGLLAGRHFDVVAASPLRRAQRTAELAGLQATDIIEDLREWDYGDLEGLTTPQIQERIHPDWTIWDGPWPGGETAADVGARCDRVIRQMLALAPATTVALVAHGHILRALAARWLEVEVPAGRMLALDTGSVSELGWEHRQPVLRRWNVVPASPP